MKTIAKKATAAAPTIEAAAATIEAAAAAPSDRQAKKGAFRAGQETVRPIQGELLAMRKSGETVLSSECAAMLRLSLAKPEMKEWEVKGCKASQVKGTLAPIPPEATPTAWERGAACELNKMLSSLHGFSLRIVRYTSNKGTTYSGFLTLLGR